MKRNPGDLTAAQARDWLAQDFPIPTQGAWPETRHRFREDDVWAIRAALATGRPLLLRGKPGMGKSQLARAAAVKLGVPFLSVVVDERTERDDLLLSYDSVARLAEAQIAGADAGPDAPGRRQRLNELNFVRPGALWWALNWEDAGKQVERYQQDGRSCREPRKPQDWDPKKPLADGSLRRGPVILVDEIDKADPSVPNGLLEALANDGFEVVMPSVQVRRGEHVGPPLVVITTNEERELPAAFLRRCLVHEMSFPEAREEAQAFLTSRARVHHGADVISKEVLEAVIQRFLDDRDKALEVPGHQPGPAEFLDVLRALVEFGMPDGRPASAKRRKELQLEALGKLAGFAFAKYLKEKEEA